MDDRASTIESKGKEKANDQTTRDRDRDRDREAAGRGSGQGNGPIISRIASSASTLSRTFFSGAPSNGGLSRLANHEKGEASGSQISDSRMSDDPIQYRCTLPAGPLLRSPSQTQNHINRQEMAFADFLDNTSVFVPTDLSDPMASWQSDASLSHALLPGTWADQTGRADVVSSVAQQELNDGQEVVALLSQSTAASPDELGNETYSFTDLSSLREALFGHDSRGDIPSADWDNVLNFIPDFLRVGGRGKYGADVVSNSSWARESSMHLGTTDTDEAWHIWIDQWTDVLTRYQDEVWGNLGSLVRDARVEVEQLGHVGWDEPPPGVKALTRLKSILGHLRGP